MAHVASYVILAHDGEQRLVAALDQLAEHHTDDPDIAGGAHVLAGIGRDTVAALDRHCDHYATIRAAHQEHEPQDFFAEPVAASRDGSIGLLRDLQDLLMLTAFVGSTWTVVQQGARAMHDQDLAALAANAIANADQLERWLRTNLKTAAPQALLLGQ
jgi:hypothetical protein